MYLKGVSNTNAKFYELSGFKAESTEKYYGIRMRMHC
jgi:hypothetical protein